MKYLIVIVIASLLVCTEKSFCQVTKDTMLARSVRLMKTKLLLSDSSAKAIVAVFKKQVHQTDSLNSNKTLKVDERQTALLKIQKEYNDQLKKILTPDQWNQYLNMEKVVRDKLINAVKDKKIPVKELG